MQQLLTGSYRRYGNYFQSALFKLGMSPRYAAGCDQAIMLRWQSSSEKAVNGKARDVFKKLAEAHEQLPQETDSVVHIGLEALESGEVERRRYDRILESTARFDAKAKNLRYVYCHYLMPESPPDESWAFDETVQWRRITGTEQRPLEYPLLVLPGDTEVRFGPYWAT